MLSKILYYIIYGWMYLHALLPLRILFVFSDIMYLFVYKLIGYRLKVVRKNIRKSFPEKTEKELLKMEQEFYRHFCDYFFETVKLLNISDQEMQQRMVFKNVEEVVRNIKNDNSCIMCLGHYGNWEWVPSITLQFDKNLLLGQIYKRLRTEAFDKIFLKLRSRFGSVSIEKHDTYRKIIKYRKEGQQVVIGFIADQRPSRSNVNYWTIFLNQETPVFIGPERIAKQTGFIVYYLDVTKTGRGRYTAECKLITTNPKEEPEYAITERYIRMFEHTILRNPAYWLWTHKRWKYKKEDFQL